MKVKEIVLSTGPTLVIAGDYIKASSTITISLDDGEDVESATKKGLDLLKNIYYRNLLLEISNVNSISKRKTRLRLATWLKGVLHGEKDGKG